MQTNNRLFDDLARLASGAVGVASEMRSEVEGRIREQFEKILAGMDLVSREEFDAVKAMAAKAREEQERLSAKVAELEARLESAAKKSKKKTTKRGAGAKWDAIKDVDES